MNGLVVLVVAPVVAFYLLLDWDRMTASIDDLLPRDHAPVIRELAADIDRTLASFVRGQGTVCLILGTFYAIALMLIGLQFGLIVGLVAGLLTFIPYVGALVGGVLSIGLALFQFWGDWIWIAAVAAVFMVGQAVEGNFLTPKLVGSSVGLHPVWLLFALAAFGTLFGFVGMLVAVPVAAMLGVLARYGIAHYRKGRLYRGLEARARMATSETMAEQLILNLPVRPALGRDDFFVSDGERRRPSPGSRAGRDWPHGKMVLVGPEASGKTHLAHVWAAMTGAPCWPPGTCPASTRKGMGAMVAVEDADRVAGAAAETALFHLHNAVTGRGGRLLLTARSDPARWPVALPDLQSRVQQAGVLKLARPTTRCLSAVMVKMAADRQLQLAPYLVSYAVRGWNAALPPPAR